MNLLSEEQYLISKAKTTQNCDPYASKAWIITAKTLFPNDFGVQFEAYRLEKEAENYEEAARCFSYIVVTFQNQPIELWNEIAQLTAALRVPEGTTTNEQEFYVRMFQHISYDVQHKILLLTANHSDNNLDHCRLILLLLKRFPQAITTHAPRLLETLIQGISIAPVQFREMLVMEALPLIIQRPPELGNHLVNQIMAITFEYYINLLFKHDPDERKTVSNEIWKKIFDVLELCGRMLKWEPFLPFNKTWNKDVYWQKLIQIVSSAPPRPSENKQILFCATILFVFSMQDYMTSTKYKTKNAEIDLILVEGFKDLQIESSKRRKTDAGVDNPPVISVNWPCSGDTSSCFVTAANCWQLLHSNEILQRDFTKIVLNSPLSSWVNRFLTDFSVYLGQSDETSSLIKKFDMMPMIEKNVRLLSLLANQGNFTIETFNLIMVCVTDLPQTLGTTIQNLSITAIGRHLVLLPLTKKSILQYCTKVIINALRSKVLLNPTACDNTVLGNLLVLLQLDWPMEITLAETIFELIRARGSFSYVLFPKYIINIDLIEEFMNMWYPHGGSIQLELSTPQPTIGSRRIGTRGADKGVKEDFKQIVKQQISKTNEDVDTLIIQFLTQEQGILLQNIFAK